MGLFSSFTNWCCAEQPASQASVPSLVVRWAVGWGWPWNIAKENENCKNLTNLRDKVMSVVLCRVHLETINAPSPITVPTLMVAGLVQALPLCHVSLELGQMAEGAKFANAPVLLPGNKCSRTGPSTTSCGSLDLHLIPVSSPIRLGEFQVFLCTSDVFPFYSWQVMGVGTLRPHHLLFPLPAAFSIIVEHWSVPCPEV